MSSKHKPFRKHRIFNRKTVSNKNKFRFCLASLTTLNDDFVPQTYEEKRLRLFFIEKVKKHGERRRQIRKICRFGKKQEIEMLVLNELAFPWIDLPEDEAKSESLRGEAEKLKKWLAEYANKNKMIIVPGTYHDHNDKYGVVENYLPNRPSPVLGFKNYPAWSLRELLNMPPDSPLVHIKTDRINYIPIICKDVFDANLHKELKYSYVDFLYGPSMDMIIVPSYTNDPEESVEWVTLLSVESKSIVAFVNDQGAHKRGENILNFVALNGKEVEPVDTDEIGDIKLFIYEIDLDKDVRGLKMEEGRIQWEGGLSEEREKP